MMDMVNAKVLKELQRWTWPNDERPALRRVFCTGGWLYATDSFRIARVRVNETVPEGAVIDREVVERMSPKDEFVELAAEGCRIGRAFFPYVEGADYPKGVADLFKVDGDHEDLRVNAGYLKDVCALAKAAGADPVLTCRRRLTVAIETPLMRAEAMLMPMRLGDDR